MFGDSNKTSRKSKEGFFEKFTRTELLLAVALIGTISYILYSTLHPVEEVQSIECEDQSCYESITEILNFVDSASDPCEDFHEFVCGNFFENAYKKQVRAPIIQEKMELKNELKAMIVEPIVPSDSGPIKLQKKFFGACMNMDEIDTNGIILSLVERVLSWPLKNERAWSEKNFDWMQVMIKCQKLGLPFQWFLEFGLHVEDRNYFKVSYPSFPTSSNRMNYIKDVTSGLLGKRTDVKDVFNFEQRLINITRKHSSETSIETLEVLEEKQPLMKWIDFLNNITAGIYVFDKDTEIATNVGDYIVELYKLITGTPKRAQANYIGWKIIEYFSPYMSENVRQYVIDKSDMDISELCIEKTKESFPYVLEAEYLKKHTSKDIQEAVRQLLELVKAEFLNRIEESTWLNTTAGQMYLDKFTETEIDIGSQDEILDDAFLDANYLYIGNLTFKEDSNVIDLILERSKSYYRTVFGTINQTGVEPDEKVWLQQIGTLSLEFSDSLNRILLPPSILQGFLYNYKRPKYLNFGSLGTLLAKGFIMYIQKLTDSESDLTNGALEQSNRCFEDDYQQLISKDEGIFSSSEVVHAVNSDIIGRDIAYAAYQKWVETNGEENELPFVQYTPNQLFWIKSSLINCYKRWPDIDERDFEATASKYKNILSARHSRNFAGDFDCSEDSSMNPPKKC